MNSGTKSTLFYFLLLLSLYGVPKVKAGTTALSSQNISGGFSQEAPQFRGRKNVSVTPDFAIVSGSGRTSQIVTAWTDYGWIILQMIAFWAAIIIKFCIVWIIWWWFYYGQSGGLYGGGGQNGFPLPPWAYKTKAEPVHSGGYGYSRVDNSQSGLFRFIFNSIDSLTSKFG